MAAAWNDHDLLVCLINVIEHSNVSLDFNGAPYPVGRNANGFKQKFTIMKKNMRPELDAIKAGVPFNTAGTGGSTPKKTATPRKTGTTTPRTPKRKSVDDYNSKDMTPKKLKHQASSGDDEEADEPTPNKAQRGRPPKILSHSECKSADTAESSGTDETQVKLEVKTEDIDSDIDAV